MICYFGRDKDGYFVDREDGSREYVDADLWKSLVEAGFHAGADITGVELVDGPVVKLQITESIRLDKYEGDVLVETLSL